VNEEQLESIAAERRPLARSLDEEGARLTVNLTEEREWHSRLAADLQREAEVLLRRQRWALASRRRRQARADAASEPIGPRSIPDDLWIRAAEPE
jgi:hypothetical protein